MSEKYLSALKEQLPTNDFQAILDPNPLLCMAIKTKDSGYVYANQNHLKLMGFSDLHQFLNKKDNELYLDTAAIKTYQADDDYIYETVKPLNIQGEISPKNHLKLKKSMSGVMHPLCVHSDNPDAVVVITKPVNQVINLNLEILFAMHLETLKKNLEHNSYAVKSDYLNFTLARMEILCFAEVLKGKNAAEISESLSIKQSTVESYLSNLRNKCGTGKKSELIQFFIDNQVLESIVI